MEEMKIVETEEVGATMVEYALMVALMAVALIAVITLLQTAVSKAVSEGASTIGNASVAGP